MRKKFKAREYFFFFFGIKVPRRRHCRRMPPDDMFFSASISAKLRELAKMRTSSRLMSRCKKVTEASTAKPWDGSMFSSSCWGQRGENVHRDH